MKNFRRLRRRESLLGSTIISLMTFGFGFLISAFALARYFNGPNNFFTDLLVGLAVSCCLLTAVVQEVADHYSNRTLPFYRLNNPEMDSFFKNLPRAAAKPSEFTRILNGVLVRSLLIACMSVGLAIIGNGITTIRQDKAAVAVLRSHNIETEAGVSLWSSSISQTKLGIYQQNDWSVVFITRTGQHALDVDPSFEGQLAIPPPNNRLGTRWATIRYDPNDVNRILLASTVAHPSYQRMHGRIRIGVILCCLAFVVGVWSVEAQLNARRG